MWFNGAYRHRVDKTGRGLGNLFKGGGAIRVRRWWLTGLDDGLVFNLRKYLSDVVGA